MLNAISKGQVLIIALVLLMSACGWPSTSDSTAPGSAADSETLDVTNLKRLTATLPDICKPDAFGALPCECIDDLSFDNEASEETSQAMVNMIMDVAEMSFDCKAAVLP